MRGKNVVKGLTSGDEMSMVSARFDNAVTRGVPDQGNSPIADVDWSDPLDWTAGRPDCRAPDATSFCNSHVTEKVKVDCVLLWVRVEQGVRLERETPLVARQSYQTDVLSLRLADAYAPLDCETVGSVAGSVNICSAPSSRNSASLCLPCSRRQRTPYASS